MHADREAMLWIAVCLPHLPLEIHAATDVALAVGDAQQVEHANAQARRAGVTRGMRRTTAFALCPLLRLVSRDLVREQAALEAVAMWALQFTPCVSLLPPEEDRPSGVLLEVQGSLSLFGGLAAIEGALRRGLAAQGHAARCASAPFAQAAWVLARARDGLAVEQAADVRSTLAPLPVWLLGPGKPHWDALQGIGVASIGDLLVLPRVGIARRFSEALVDELDRALGSKPDPRVWFKAPPTFDMKVELMARVDSAEALLFAARRLIVQLAGWLTSRHAAARALTFTLKHEDRAPTRLPLQLADASNDETRFCSLLREVLGRLKLAAPVYELALRCDEVVQATAPSAQLFPAPQTQREGLMRLLERLQVRLGRERVTALALREDHRPEFAFVALAADAGARRAAPCAARRLPRPLWLLAQPVPLEERQHLPVYGSVLTLLAGPERIESGWWDGQWVARDYFVARDESNALLWVFRPRAPDPRLRQGWYLHGRFG
jgi:protein ImuB